MVNNNELIENAKDLIYLTSCAVNCINPDPEVCDRMNLDEIGTIARNHLLIVSASMALQKVRKIPLSWKEPYGIAIRRYYLFQTERTKLLQRLEESGIWYLPMKGIVIQDCYPNPVMREMSDNDILFDMTAANRLRQIMKSMGYACTEFVKVDHGHDVYVKTPVTFEMHRTLLFRYPYSKVFDYYDKKTDLRKKDNNNQYGYHLTHEDFYIYLIFHLFKHYSRNGTGLRSLLDVHVYLNKYGDILDWEYINGELDTLELRDFETMIRDFATKVFTFQPLSDEENKRLLFFVNSNAHGTLHTRLTKQANAVNSSKFKKQYLLSRAFPPIESLQLHHPIVYRHKYLYPFFVITRSIKGLFTHPKKLIYEYRTVRRFQKEPDDHVESEE